MTRVWFVIDRKRSGDHGFRLCPASPSSWRRLWVRLLVTVVYCCGCLVWLDSINGISSDVRVCLGVCLLGFFDYRNCVGFKLLQFLGLIRKFCLRPQDDRINHFWVRLPQVTDLLCQFLRCCTVLGVLN